MGGMRLIDERWHTLIGAVVATVLIWARRGPKPPLPFSIGTLLIVTTLAALALGFGLTIYTAGK
jgi:hypothetical protein